jgi:hypothetical protein
MQMFQNEPNSHHIINLLQEVIPHCANSHNLAIEEHYFKQKKNIPSHWIIIYRLMVHHSILFSLSYGFSTNLRQEIFSGIEELLQDIDEQILLYSNASDMFILLYIKDHYDCQVQSIDICIPIFSFLSYPLC